MPAIKVLLCVPLVPMRMVLDSPATPGVADIDIVVSGGEITAGGNAEGDIIRAGGITRERVVALRRVVATDRVTDERIGPRGGVVVASGIA